MQQNYKIEAANKAATATNGAFGTNSKKISIEAAGIKLGGSTTVCRNLFAPWPGSGLTLMPPLRLPVAATGAEGENDVEQLVSMPQEYPAVRFRAVEAGELAATVGSFHSSGIISASTPLSASESERYSKSLCTAYSSLVAEASAGEVSIQPLLARYRYLDSHGRTLFLSEASVVALPSGWQMVDHYQASLTEDADEKGFTIGELRLTARAFRTEVDVPSLAAFPAVKMVEIELSPMLHPVDFGAEAYVRISRVQSNAPQIWIALPGATAGATPLGRVRSNRVAELAASPAGVMSIVKRLSPAAEASTVVLSVPAIADAEGDCRRINDVVTAAVPAAASEAQRFMNLCRQPHGFSARRRFSSGSTVLYSGVTARRWSGPHPAELIVAEPDEETVEATATVTVRAGDKVIATRTAAVGIALSSAPKMEAMAAYPDPSATSLTLAVVCGAEQFEATIRLTADRGMRTAIYAAPGLQQLELQRVEQLTAAGVPEAGLTMPGVVLAAPVGEPFNPIAVTDTDSGEILAFAAADTSSRQWDSSTARTFGVTEAAVLGIATDIARATCSAVALHTDVGATAAVVAADAVYLATRSGISRLTSSGLKTVAAVSGGLTAIEFDSDYGMITALRGDGSYAAFDGDGVRYDCDPQNREEFEWKAAISLLDGARIAGVAVDMLARQFNGSVELWAAGPGGEVMLAAIDVENADIERPIWLRAVESPLRHRLIVRVAGRAESVAIRSAVLTV